ncbi:APC family permease [Propionibacteriaceae bacterium Y1685]|uniref:APC family permease n=1 Tax=Microlunatus sp. Y1700 TaxID=3418487 RepID=UPI003B795042
MTTSQPTLLRRLRTRHAVLIGLSSMIGAGLFAAFAPAARAAGNGLLIGLAVAAVVAVANATSSAQLAAQHPTSGGTYAYGRAQLGPWPGFLAGWGFVIGKTASCAAMALTFAAYVAPAGWERPLALVAIAVITAVNLRGITRTATLATVLVALVLLALAATMIIALTAHIGPWHPIAPGSLLAAGPYGILQSAGLLFFAFAGYARIATLGEEVVAPSTTIPRAIVIALGAVVVLYGVVAVLLLRGLGADQLGTASDPLAQLIAATSQPALAPIVMVGAALASLGALLALVAGIGRTAMAMAREGDLPRALAAVHPVHRVPYRAELAAAVAMALLVLIGDLRGAIGFSSFGVLVYYFVANASALTQRDTYRRYPRALAWVGLIGCAVLVATLPWPAVLAGVAVFAVGVVARLVSHRGR